MPIALGALGLALISYNSAMVTARGFALKNRYDLDSNQEFIALGVADIGAGLLRGFAISGADSRTAVNDSVGGKTQLTGVVAAVLLVVVLLFFTGPLALLPITVLSAVLINAALGLFDVESLRWLRRASPQEFRLSLVTLLGVITVGVLPGVVVAVALALVQLLARASRPHDAVLGRIPGVDGYRDVSGHPDAVTIPRRRRLPVRRIAAVLQRRPLQGARSRGRRRRAVEAAVGRDRCRDNRHRGHHRSRSARGSGRGPHPGRDRGCPGGGSRSDARDAGADRTGREDRQPADVPDRRVGGRAHRGLIPEPESGDRVSEGMRTRPRTYPGALVLGLALLLGGAGTAGAGQMLAVVACDSVATEATAFEVFLWSHGSFSFCRAEVRPHVSQYAPPLAVRSWEMPEGWSAAWLADEPGAIEISGCANHSSPVMRIEFASRVGSVEVQFFDDESARMATWVGTIRCDSTVPALPVSWGAVKSQYR